MLLDKKFIFTTGVLYVSSIISYYSQIKIIDMYGLDTKYYVDLYMSYFQIAITIIILGLPNAITVLVSREKKITKNIKTYSLIGAFIASTILNIFFLDGNIFIQIFILLFIFVSIFNDLNTGIMNSIGMFEYPRYLQLVGNVMLLSVVFLNPITWIGINFTDLDYALLFMFIPILPLFLAIIFGKNYNNTLSQYEMVDISYLFKYLNFIYLFTILSIMLSKIPYINYSDFIDKYNLAQYTLSFSLSNFLVIPLNLLTLKILGTDMKNETNIGLINFVLVMIVLFIVLVLYWISSSFSFLNDFTNISSSEILVSTCLVVSLVAISSINISISLRLQKYLLNFLVVDTILVILVYFITANFIQTFDKISNYNYIIALFVFIKILYQNYLLKEKNVHNNNTKL